MPTHYEPHESPFRNPLYGQQANPTRKVYGRDDNPSNPSPPEPHGQVYPFVLTTSRLTEHHTAGGMSRQLPYLSELQPEMFVEVSPELAAERGLEHLGWATVVTSRSAIEARVLVTDRLTPLRVQGRVVHQVWMPYHWGSAGLVTGRLGERPVRRRARPERAHPGVEGDHLRRPAGAAAARARAARLRAGLPDQGRRHPRPPGTAASPRSVRVRGQGRTSRAPGTRAFAAARRRNGTGGSPGRQSTDRPRRSSGMTLDNSLSGPLDDVAGNAGHTEHPPRVGFFTDTSICIGCKACEVACKEWNLVPDDGFNLLGMSYDNTGMLGANTWRHVAFIEQPLPARAPAARLRGPADRAAGIDGQRRGRGGVPRDVADKGAELGNRPAERTAVTPPVDRRPSTWACRASSCPARAPARRAGRSSAG